MSSDGQPSNPSPFNPPGGNNYSVNINSRIMLTAIMSLFFVIILVGILHVYARCKLRRHARRRTAIHQLGLALAHSNETPKSGLDPAVISSLPIFTFKRLENQSETEISECVVCLSFLEEGETAKVLPNCKHTLHAECIDKWLSLHSTCPICRTEAEPRQEPAAANGSEIIIASMAPPLERVNSNLTSADGTSDSAGQSSARLVSSGSRLSSFRRMLNRERSSNRIQPSEQEDAIEDLERQQV